MRKAVIIFVLIMMLNIVCVKGERKSLILKIKAVKDVILDNEPFEIEVSFISKNGEFKIYKHNILGMGVMVGEKRWLKFVIIGPDGKRVKEYSPSESITPKMPYRGDYIKVTTQNPYRDIVKIYPVRRYFPFKIPWKRVGVYEVKAIYSYRYNKEWKYGKDLWEGKIESNRIRIKVIKSKTKLKKRRIECVDCKYIYRGVRNLKFKIKNTGKKPEEFYVGLKFLSGKIVSENLNKTSEKKFINKVKVKIKPFINGEKKLIKLKPDKLKIIELKIPYKMNYEKFTDIKENEYINSVIKIIIWKKSPYDRDDVDEIWTFKLYPEYKHL